VEQGPLEVLGLTIEKPAGDENVAGACSPNRRHRYAGKLPGGGCGQAPGFQTVSVTGWWWGDEPEHLPRGLPEVI
jgi:hypothetical protein